MTVITAFDVGYRTTADGEIGTCGVVGFTEWSAGVSSYEAVVKTTVTEPYVPGKLYLRELPCLLAGLAQFEKDTATKPTLIVVDGNVRLDQDSKAGLGKRLFIELRETIQVVGVSKNPYAGLDAIEVHRGESKKPIHVTAVGIDESAAATHITSMHGMYRIPTMLRLADQLAST